MSCESGWESRPGSTSCYKFVNSNAGQLKWGDARSYCQNKGGDLIKINGNDELVRTLKVARLNRIVHSKYIQCLFIQKDFDHA